MRERENNPSAFKKGIRTWNCDEISQLDNSIHGFIALYKPLKPKERKRNVGYTLNAQKQAYPTKRIKFALNKFLFSTGRDSQVELSARAQGWLIGEHVDRPTLLRSCIERLLTTSLHIGCCCCWWWWWWWWCFFLDFLWLFIEKFSAFVWMHSKCRLLALPVPHGGPILVDR